MSQRATTATAVEEPTHWPQRIEGIPDPDPKVSPNPDNQIINNTPNQTKPGIPDSTDKTEQPKTPDWSPETARSTQTGMHTPRRSTRSDEGGDETRNKLNNLQRESDKTNDKQGMRQTNKAFLAAARRPSNHPISGAIAPRRKTDAVHTDTAMNLNHPQPKPPTIAADNNKLTSAHAIHRQNIINSSLVNAPDTNHLESDNGDQPVIRHPDMRGPKEINPVPESQEHRRQQSHGEDGPDHEQILALPQPSITSPEALNERNQTQKNTIEELPAHPKSNHHHRPMQPSSNEEARDRLDDMMHPVRRNERRGATRHINKPNKDTRVATHVTPHPDRQHPRNTHKRLTRHSAEQQGGLSTRTNPQRTAQAPSQQSRNTQTRHRTARRGPTTPGSSTAPSTLPPEETRNASRRLKLMPNRGATRGRPSTNTRQKRSKEDKGNQPNHSRNKARETVPETQTHHNTMANEHVHNPQQRAGRKRAQTPNPEQKERHDNHSRPITAVMKRTGATRGSRIKRSES
ncbi:hypothetical protein [Halomonas cupida]|uniref:Uncharacterized protein n=1 Tax=Halomonas cupida TaxID=44933 RepID=A0A1M7JJN5_9GAMM|nr:hypothetical protein [Halomonas cupida]SHM52983.1 hypothetical protein SAMN05660971_03187 [Halomonas cupida]